MWLNMYNALLDAASKVGRQGSDKDLKLFGIGSEGIFFPVEIVPGALSVRSDLRPRDIADVKDPLVEMDFSGCPEGAGDIEKAMVNE